MIASNFELQMLRSIWVPSDVTVFLAVDVCVFVYHSFWLLLQLVYSHTTYTSHQCEFAHVCHINNFWSCTQCHRRYLSEWTQQIVMDHYFRLRP